MAAGERTGKCINIGNCSLADKREVIVTKPGTDFVCPECGKALLALPAVPGGGGGNRRTAIIAGALALLVLLAAGLWFGLHGRKMASGGAGDSTIAAVPDGVEPVLRLGGSNTIGAKLAPALVAGYFKSLGCADPVTSSPAAEESVVRCETGGKTLVATIAAHGSATAFKGLADASLDIGMASRKIKADETTSLAKLGDMTAPSNEHVLGLDGIAVIVHPGNRIASLTIDQVGAIFTGVITDFAKAGGAAGPIKVLARDDKSGTYDTFKSLVLGKTPLVDGAKRFEDSAALSTEVANDPAAIGFVGLATIGGAKAVAVGPASGVSLIPNRMTVATEDYILSRRLYLYVAASSTKPDVARFLQFANSPEGQKLVEAAGFVPLTIRQEKSAAPSGAPSGYDTLVAKALRLSVNFRFRTGSADLDNRALADLDRVTEFLASSSVQPDRLMLLGFADSRGGEAMNQKLSEGRAQTVAAALAQRGVKAGVVRGFGTAIPIADNNTPEGQEKNRRVEVWVAR
ncbi:substrate-binding domain-containing protein [Sphingomonas bacterium]|uniref:substrate-binding domain-containing protein n=1 Tax=Sphingomonas bacterium TaxID=1895847 RepID=UPI0015776D38|nr:phosphate ABC transporter substrate-binding/OmpA family protein [Sphingomonas bacterium]